jgi:hypothetical protein
MHACPVSLPSTQPRGAIVPQGCSDYTQSDLARIGSANPVGCATLTGSRATNCDAAHTDVTTYCGPATCAAKKKCLTARQLTMGYFDAEIKGLQNCKAGSWKRDRKMKDLADTAIANLQTGYQGHQQAIDLVKAWIKSNCH